MEKNCLIIDGKKFYDTKSIYDEYKNSKYDGEIKFIETKFPIRDIIKKYIFCEYTGDAKFFLWETIEHCRGSGITFLYSHGPIIVVYFQHSRIYRTIPDEIKNMKVDKYIYDYVKNYVSDITGINCLAPKSGKYDNIILDEEKIDDAKILENKRLIVGTRSNNIIFRQSMNGYKIEKLDDSLMNLNLPIELFAARYYYTVHGKNAFISNAEEITPEDLIHRKKIIIGGNNKIYILRLERKKNISMHLLKQVPEKFTIRDVNGIDVDILNYHISRL